MLVGCPKCKTRLKLPDEKIKPEGTKFKCPKCAALLLVKKPAAKPAAAPPRPGGVDLRKALVAHEKPQAVERAKVSLASAGYTVLTAFDGVSAILQAVKERPALAVLDIALPRIHGVEVSKRLKARPETKDMKSLVVCSKDDPRRRVREPEAAGIVDGYVFEDELGLKLLDAVARVTKSKLAAQQPAMGVQPPSTAAVQPPPAAPRPMPTVEPPVEEAAPPPPPPPPRSEPEPSAFKAAPSVPPQPTVEKATPPPQPQPPVSRAVPPPTPPPARAAGPAPAALARDESPEVSRARRLARTIFSDIDLYNPDKVAKAVREGNFGAVFEDDLKEGLKLYRRRIPEEVRSKGDFFEEVMKDFLANKRRALGL